MKSSHSAVTPIDRTDPADWPARHQSFVQEAQKGRIDILFIGDSIVDGWRDLGLQVWSRYYAPRRAANFGIDGDRTQHVLWRISHGELDGIKPRVVVLLIGTNNTGREKDSDNIRNTVPETIDGIRAVIGELRARLPDSKILVLAILPRGTVDDPQRAQITSINTAIAGLDDGQKVKFLDLSPNFVGPDGAISVMPDLLHLDERGYQIWAEAMEPTLAEMLK